MRIFFSAGDPSGDLHAANLIRRLRDRRPDIECVGYGGPRMAEAGCRLHYDLTELAVMWFARALANFHKFWELMSRADRFFRREKVDAVVLVDYPGFNWWIARRAKARGIPVFYYAPPQLWAWASWRVKKMRRLVDHVLCGLPFEQEWFTRRGCNATFVGHPYFDEVRRQQLDEQFLARQRSRGGRRVTILPGSRTQEVTHNLKWFLKAAEVIRQRVPDVRFAVASFKPSQARIAEDMIKSHRDAVDVFVGRTPELIEMADCCMATSGSVSLELLYRTTPTVILYWVPRYAHFVQSLFRRVKYITLVNLLSAADPFPEVVTPFDPDDPTDAAVPFPEYLTFEDESARLAGHVTTWLTDQSQHRRRVVQLARLKSEVAGGGASKKAAEYILAHLPRQTPVIPRPHFMPASHGVPRGLSREQSR